MAFSSYSKLVAFFLLSASLATLAMGQSTCYSDSRDEYFSQPLAFMANPEDDGSPIPPDRCRLAEEMEKEIEYLRNLMDKCDRCWAGTESISDGRKCADSPCARGASCTDTKTGTVCGPCPVGYDGNGVSCIPRTC